MSFYKGNDETKFHGALHNLNGFYLSGLPDILVKNQSGRYFKVIPSFPRLGSNAKLITYTETQEDKDLSEKVQKMIEESEFIMAELPNCKREECTREQENGIVCAETLQQFSSVLKQRIDTVAHYDECRNTLSEFQQHGVSTELQFTLLSWSETKDVNDKKNIMEKYQSYAEAKTKFKSAYDKFVSSCVSLVNVEKTPPSNISYLSKKAFDSAVLQEFKKSPMECYDAQELLWGKVISKLTGLTSNESKEDGGSNPTRKIERKRIQFIKLIERVNTNSPSLSEEGCRAYITELSKKKASIEDTMCENPNITDEDLEDICLKFENSMMILTDRLKEVKEEQEQLRLEKQQNNKVLPQIKLMKLRGSENYLDWLENQRVLNTHVDPYKRGQVLKETIVDQELLKRLDGIVELEEIIGIVQDKFARMSLLIPAMLDELKNTSPAKTNEEVVSLMGKINNVFSKIKRLGSGALSRIDQSIIEQLLSKFPRTFQEKYEEYLLDHKNDLQFDDTASTVIENHEYFDVIKDMTPIQVNEENVKMRRNFIKFLKRQESVNSNIQVRAPAKNKEYKSDKVVRSQKVRTFSTLVKEEQGQSQSGCPMPGCKKSPHKNKKGFVTSSLSACPLFRALETSNKKRMVSKFKHCYMCLKPECSINICRIKDGCFNCGKRHHVFLCEDKKSKGEKL